MRRTRKRERGSISVNAQYYERLQDQAEREGVTMAAIVERTVVAILPFVRVR